MYGLIGQEDPRWAKKMLGNSGLTIGADGCFLTAICNGVNQLLPNGHVWTPDQLAANPNNFNAQGELIEDAVCAQIGTIKYLGAIYGENDAAIQAALKNPNQFAVLNVLPNGGHFVLAWHKVPLINDYIIADSLDGKLKDCKMMYHCIVGIRLFQTI